MLVSIVLHHTVNMFDTPCICWVVVDILNLLHVVYGFKDVNISLSIIHFILCYNVHLGGMFNYRPGILMPFS